MLQSIAQTTLSLRITEVAFVAEEMQPTVKFQHKRVPQHWFETLRNY